jgi:hypothetical protein
MTAERELPDVHVYTPEEIELLLSGDRRSIDRLLMQGINTIALVMVPHMRWEEKVLASLGSPEEIAARVAWIKTQITRQQVHNDMMRKVTESVAVWAFIAFIGFVFYSIWEHVVSYLHMERK